jgi:hypothetical protein
MRFEPVEGVSICKVTDDEDMDLYLIASNDGGGMCVVLMSVKEVLDMMILVILKCERERDTEI